MINFKPLLGFLAYNNISLKELAEKAGVNYATVLRLSKHKDISWSSLGKICECLNLNIKDIMRYELEV